MTGQPEEPEQQLVRRAAVALRTLGHPNSIARATDFWDDRYEWRRLFAEVLGTFFLVLVAVGGGMVNARFGGQAVPYSARVVAPALMVMTGGYFYWNYTSHYGKRLEHIQAVDIIFTDIVTTPANAPAGLRALGLPASWAKYAGHYYWDKGSVRNNPLLPRNAEESARRAESDRTAVDDPGAEETSSRVSVGQAEEVVADTRDGRFSGVALLHRSHALATEDRVVGQHRVERVQPGRLRRGDHVDHDGAMSGELDLPRIDHPGYERLATNRRRREGFRRDKKPCKEGADDGSTDHDPARGGRRIGRSGGTGVRAGHAWHRGQPATASSADIPRSVREAATRR